MLKVKHQILIEYFILDIARKKWTQIKSYLTEIKLT
jgi:hypothetical protein